MAKHFDKKEKSTITKALFAAGLKRFSRLGVRAVRIDDLCKDVGVAKGSFYTFFPSKEALFMSIAQQRDEQHKRDMRQFLAEFSGPLAQFASDFFDLVVDKINTDPMLQLMIEHGEIEYLLRKIPAELLAKNAATDRAFVEELANALRTRNPDSSLTADQLDGLMTLTVSLLIQRVMPPTQMKNALELLRQTYIAQLANTASSQSTISSEQTDDKY